MHETDGPTLGHRWKPSKVVDDREHLFDTT